MRQIIILLCVTTSFFSTAQDVHFTMFNIMPSTVNPASTGVIQGDIRGVLNYRNQWSSIGSPYKTFAASVDGKLLNYTRKKVNLGMGLSIYKDVAGDSQYGTTSIAFSTSSMLKLDNLNILSVGLSGAFGQTSMNQSNLQWDNQFNGQYYDPSSSSNESVSFEKNNYLDFSIGTMWAYGYDQSSMRSGNDFSMKAGVAFYHVNKPTYSHSLEDLDKLYSKLVIHGESHIGLTNTNMALRPKLITYFQGPSKEITAGFMMRYQLKEASKYTGMFNDIAISIGAYYRVGDAFAPAMEFELSSFDFGFAYDMNLSGLSVATGGNGGPEVYLRFIPPSGNSKSRARLN